MPPGPNLAKLPVFTIKCYRNHTRAFACDLGLLSYCNSGSSSNAQTTWLKSLNIYNGTLFSASIFDAHNLLLNFTWKNLGKSNSLLPPYLNPFFFPAIHTNLKDAQNLNFCQVSHFFRIFNAMVYLDEDFPWRSRFFFIVLYLFRVHFSINGTEIICALSHT